MYKISVAEAAKKIGCSRITLERGLIAGRFPFGTAVQNPESETWTYIISEKALDFWLEYGTQYVLKFEDGSSKYKI